ncbi:MAG: thermopsin family protease [Candidatus Bathyarchaeia archaeon]|jgi:hypothetical protein
MNRKAVVSFVLIVFFLISVFPISTLSGAAASHGSSGVSESQFTAARGGNASGLVPDPTKRDAVAPHYATPLPKTSGAAGPLDTSNVTAYSGLPGYTQASGLVGYWKLDEGSGTTAYDSSGNNNNGIVIGASWTAGKVGSALSFDGVVDYVSCGTGSSLMPTAAITLEAWFNANDVSTYGTIASTYYSEGYFLRINPNAGIEFAPGICYSPPGIIQPGVWYHVVGTFDGATAKLYVNGRLVGSQQSGYLAYNGQSLSIGNNPGGTSWFNGIIDEVKIYNIALSDQQIWAEYTSYLAGPYCELLGETFTQNSGSMSYSVTAVQQDYDDSFALQFGASSVTGPACLLCGLSDQGYMYEVGLSWDWFGTNANSSISGFPYTPGFNANYFVFDPSGSTVYYYWVSLSVNQGDSVNLFLSFSGGNVLMQVYDPNTGATSSGSYSSSGATYFVGLPNYPQTPPPQSAFSGLMTEQLHTNPYYGNMQQVWYSDMTSTKSSAWMWMQEIDSAGNSLFSVSTINSISFVRNPGVFQLFNSSGATEYSNVYQFATGVGVRFSTYNFYISILPASITMNLGSSVLFTSSVFNGGGGGSSPYSYQWYLNGSSVTGATSSSWTFTPQSAGSYTVWAGVTDNQGILHAASNTATVTVIGLLSVSISPSSVTMPVSGFGSGQPFPSTVSGGLPPYKYQWYLNSQAVSAASGGTLSTWVFYPQYTGSYTVYVRVTDSQPLMATSNTATVNVANGGIDVYCFDQIEPAPMGIADYGMEPSGPYQYNTTSFVGTVTVASLSTLVKGTTSNHDASFQLNVKLQINTIYGPLVFWVQNVAAVTTSASGNTLTLNDFVDNVWNYSSFPAPNTSSSGISGNNPTPIKQDGSCYVCSAYQNTHDFQPVTLTNPTTITLNVTSRMSYSGPTVSFAFDIDGSGLVTFDTVTFTNVVGFTSLAGFEVNGFNYDPAGTFYNAALILGAPAARGPPPPTTAVPTVQSQVQLQLEYWNGHNYQIVPYAYNFGSGTGELIDNVMCGFSYNQNGETFETMTNGAGQLGPLYYQSQMGVINITSTLTSGTLYVTSASNPNVATAWQIPFVNGQVTVTLYPGTYLLQLYNQNGVLIDYTTKPVSAGQTLSLQSPFNPLSVSVSPSSVVMNVGQSVLFTLSVSGGASPYSYQWFLNGNPQYWGYSSWTFTPSSSGSYTVYATVLDSVGATAKSNTAAVTVNGPAALWSLQWNSTFGGGGHSQFAQPCGDLDGDGVNEIVVGGYESSGIARILKYDKTSGTYYQVYSWTEGGGTYNSPSGATMLDLYGNGSLELVMSWAYCGANDGVWAYKWDGTTLTKLDHFYCSFTYDVYSCDFDGDGVKEVVVANAPWGGYAAHVIGLGWNKATSKFYVKAQWMLPGYSSMECSMVWSGDIKGDGKTRIVACISDSSTGTTAGTWALTWNATSNTWNAELVYAGLIGGGIPYGVAVGDVDGDGIAEIGIGNNVAGYAGAGAVLVKWDGVAYNKVWEGSWPSEYSVIEGVAIGDGENIGKNQFYVGGGNVHVISWIGTGYAEQSTITGAFGLISGVNIADFNNDGQNELKLCDIGGYGPGNEWIFKYAFSPVTYTLTISATAGGTTTPVPGVYSYAAGSVVGVSARPNVNYGFDHWVLDGVNVGPANPTSVTMNTNHALQAVFGSGFAYTDKLQYAIGDTVIVGFQNTGSTTITLSNTAPWVILDASGRVVYNPIAEYVLVSVLPGEKREWGWNQKDYSGQQVSSGTYTLQITTWAGSFTAKFNVTLTITGDVNGDGRVNILDDILVSNAFLSTPSSPNWNHNADINGDGVVNILDDIILSNHWTG